MVRTFELKEPDPSGYNDKRKESVKGFVVNLAQLQYFQHLAEVGNYSRAAESFFISQSALSHSMAALEDELGCPLFARKGRQVVLTEEGEAFKRYIDEGLSAISQGVAEIARRRGELSGTVRVGAIAPVRSWYLPEAMGAYRAEYGSLVEFRVAQGETAPLNARLAQGDFDLVIAGPVEKKGIACKALYYQRLVVAVNRSHPLAKKKEVTFSDLVGYDVASYREGIACGRLLTDFLKASHAPVDGFNLIRNYEDEVILGALAIHEPIVSLTMITSNLMVDSRMAVLPLREPGALTFYPVTLSYQEKKFRSPAAQAFIDFLGTFDAPEYKRSDFPYATTVPFDGGTGNTAN